MDRIVTFLLLLVSALLLVPGCIAEEQVIPETTEVVPEALVASDATEEVTSEVADEVPAEEAEEIAGDELPVYNVTADVNTTELVVPMNEVIMISLAENPTTGYTWNVTLSEGLTLLNDVYVQDEAEEGMVGVGGVHEWFIEAVEAGEQTFYGIEQQAQSEETGSEYTLKLIVE
ncbi:MAG TPA: protease inhibitor I42 family protein [Methanospirillum sp.]|jgi:inhibitor of cysteine peptidase|uniref:protease inhibitor I42 family protein n=1 Tax=Methanospirillum sp. TaxID=45200 RepID=UPI001BD4E5BA|nr:protease inhibitor I42 family protein [Methanospirillum sp.]HPY59633.1 protease inhibitor I42 family protein [Methanospirillum sp.]